MDQKTVARKDVPEHDDATGTWLHKHHSTSLGTSNIDENHGGIAERLYTLCLESLRQLYRREQAEPRIENRAPALREELGKFYLWGESLRGGKLEKAIDYSDEVRCDVLELLAEVARLLKTALHLSPSDSALEGSHNPAHEFKYLLEQANFITSNTITNTTSDAFEQDNSDESEDDEQSDIIDELGVNTRLLTQLLPTLEHNWRRAQTITVQLPHSSFSVSGPAQIYVSLVREKYKDAQNQLIERLGEANWQRHLEVRQRKGAPQVVEERYESKSIFQPHSAFYGSGLGTSYASSHTSYESGASENQDQAVRVPATPAEVFDMKPFVCSLCNRLISGVKSRVDWRMHVFSDLRPYICTFSDCTSILTQFDRRATWAEHEFTQHRDLRSWTCPECPQEFSDASDWDLHLIRCHNVAFSGSNLEAVRSMALKISDGLVEEEECPLCRVVVGKPRRGFIKHVGRHMEEIALMALPRDVDDDADEASESSDHEVIVSDHYNFDDQHTKSLITSPLKTDAAAPSNVSIDSAGSPERSEKSPDNAVKLQPRVLREDVLPGGGPVWVYEDGSICPKKIDGEPVNTERGITKAGKLRKRLAIACTTCREKKIKCQPRLSKCAQCEKFGRECRYVSQIGTKL